MGMSRQQAIKIISQMIKDEEGFLSDNTVEAHKMAIKALSQEPTDKSFTKADIDAIVKAINAGWELRVNEILDKIYADIQKLRGCSCSCSDGIIDDVEDIIDKYKAKVEPQESEEV